jgi:hypothetical protein
MDDSSGRMWLVSRRIQRVVLALVLLAPLAAFFGLQAVIGATRSGSVGEVWFLRTADGPRLVARDEIAVGSERSVKLRHRLVLVDLTSGERLARRKVGAPLELVGATSEVLWFRDRRDGSDLHARSARTLERLDAAGVMPTLTPIRAPPAEALSVATLPGGVRIDAPRAEDPQAFLLPDSATGELIAFTDPPSVLAVTHGVDGLLLSRIEDGGPPVWRVPLERQRGIRAASRVGEVVVLITSGAARDFAVAVDAGTGQTRWVHHF